MALPVVLCGKNRLWPSDLGDCIIIVDDAPDMAWLVASFLKSHKALKAPNVHSFTNGPDARAFIEENRVDVALLDLDLGGVDDGESLAKLLIEYNIDTRAYLLTSCMDEEKLLMLEKTGYFVEVLRKPVKVDTILLKVVGL